MISFWTNKSKNTFLLPLSFWQSVRGTPSKLKTENENSLEIAAEAPVGVYSNGCTNNNNTPLLYTHTRKKIKLCHDCLEWKKMKMSVVCAVYGLLLLALLFVWTICLFGVKERAILHSFFYFSTCFCFTFNENEAESKRNFSIRKFFFAFFELFLYFRN